MMRLRPFVAALACVSAVAAATAVMASADPSNSNTTTWEFTNCTGPAGTPTSFTATRERFIIPTGANVGQPPLFHVTGSSALFQVFTGVNLTTGVPFTYNGQGFDRNGLLTVTCNTTSPLTGFQFLFTGFLTPPA